MRNINSLFLVSLAAVSATACAGRAHTNQLTTAATYSCDAVRSIAVKSGSLQMHNSDVRLAEGWRDDGGSHFVSWPTSSTTLEAVEYVVPNDFRADAIERVYDTSGGTSRADWKLVRSTTCTANGGYSDALARFAGGKSFDQLAKELDVDKKGARELVHRALLSLNKRYYRDR